MKDATRLVRFWNQVLCALVVPAPMHCWPHATVMQSVRRNVDEHGLATVMLVFTWFATCDHALPTHLRSKRPTLAAMMEPLKFDRYADLAHEWHEGRRFDHNNPFAIGGAA
ncbi:MAG: hypothetical protein AAGA48_28705 [Myxococcota bacterium]